MDFLLWLADKFLEICDLRPKIKVLVHGPAFLRGGGEEFYFVKVVNLSPKNIFTVTHVWVKDGDKEIDIINAERPLPHKLETSDIWEIWFPKDLIENHERIFESVRVVLSNGKEYTSKRNTEVRPTGFIA